MANSSSSLTSHVLSLITSSSQAGPSSSFHIHDESSWDDLLNTWEAEESDQPSQGAASATSLLELPPPTPLPTLLDYYHPLPLAPLPQPPPDQASAPPPKPTSTQATQATNIATRLQSHLHDSSLLSSLISLLTSSLSPDMLQDDLVSLLGFEGDALALTEQILSLTAEEKKAVVGALKGKGRGGGSRTPARGSARDEALMGLSQEEANRRIEEQLRENENRPLWSGTGHNTQQEVYPHVYTSASTTGMQSYGGRLALPVGTIRKENDISQEVIIPPAIPIPPKISERLIPIRELGPLAAGCFPGYESLNRIQSIVQPTAMTSNENMLICAPTGAGKTDVAIMSILRVLSLHIRPGATLPYNMHTIDRDKFKVIYVAPMKALAAEITRKFEKRLKWLGIKVRELTGDMQMTRQEIAETQIIITTPEKWDVVTRKPTGEGELASKVRLLIIDEIHLLNEDRGAVIETIVARTLRQVESTQSLIRIVGLSATLPNYIDVSDFLRVNRYQGLFYFDSSFRPVPLEQRFIGVRGKVRSEQSKRNMDQVVFEKVSEMLSQGHQVMVFVHARRETVKTAEKLKEMAMSEGAADDFDPRLHPQFDFFRREIGTSRNKEMKQLFDYGFGIHHAGMLRSDRNMMERMFEANCIKVLCCTATLAWGVNLPAHAVVIKGTQVYDAGRGSFVDLSILDVLQIFGRAGRPGYETSGVGFICTTQDKLDHYLDAVLSQHPIESKFVPGMVDSLNAEISLGTIRNMQEAIEWLGYTYLFVRMKRNPFVYGMPHDEPIDDPQLGSKREALVHTAAGLLDRLQMIKYDQITSVFYISDLGRVAAKYYLKHETVEILNEHFKAKMTEADCLALLSMSTEFDQLQVRENEIEELKNLMNNVIPCQVKGGTDTTPGKVNILLQAFICKQPIEDFALVSDTAYVAQNAARIIRALLEVALSKKWASAAGVLASMSKSIEERMWSYENPLKQSTLKQVVIHSLERHADDYTPTELAQFSAADLGEMLKLNELHGKAVLEVARQFPATTVRTRLRPLSHSLLRVDIGLDRNFKWNVNVHGHSEPFYVWLEDQEGINILQWSHITFKSTSSTIDLEFIVPMEANDLRPLTLRVVSDRWVGCEETLPVSVDDLLMPESPAPNTSLLNIPFLPITALQDTTLQATFRSMFTTFNSIQSQAFWTIYHTDLNVLLSAPNASGKTTLGDIACRRTAFKDPSARILYLCHQRQSARETVARLNTGRQRSKAQLLSGPSDVERFARGSGGIAVCNPAVLLRSLPDLDALCGGLSLLVADDLHLLDDEYELAMTLALFDIQRRQRCRVFGLCCTVVDPTDLATWLGVTPEGLYAFSTANRATPVVTTARSFNIPHSATLMKSMVKPVYAAAKKGIARQTIVFIPSSGQCRTAANDLITQSGTEMDLNGFLQASREDVEPMLLRLRDSSLSEAILHGIGVFYAGMNPADAAIVLELFASGIVPVLLASRETCWTLPVQAGTVMVMGAQYVELPPVGSRDPTRPMERKLRNYSLEELVKMQGFAARPPPSTSQALKDGNAGGQFHLMCQDEQVDAYVYFLNQGLPLESKLPESLTSPTPSNAFGAIAELLGPDSQRQDLMDLLSWSFLWLRMQSNPTYYDTRPEEQSVRLSRLADGFFARLFKKPEVAKPNGDDSKLVEPQDASFDTPDNNPLDAKATTFLPAKPTNGQVNGKQPQKVALTPSKPTQLTIVPPTLTSLHSSASSSSMSLHSAVNGSDGVNDVPSQDARAEGRNGGKSRKVERESSHPRSKDRHGKPKGRGQEAAPPPPPPPQPPAPEGYQWKHGVLVNAETGRPDEW